MIVVLPVWGPTDPLVQLRIYQGLVIVLACSFATGSAAIAFAGEVEAKTKGLLQRIPVRPRDLLAGKLSLSLAGSYALLFALWLAGGLMLMQSTAASFSRVGARDVSHEMTTFLQFLLGPFVFVVVGGLFSLILSDVLLTVLVAGLSTAVFMAIPVIRDHLALQAAVIAIVGLCDFFLARRWLRDAGAVEWKLLPRITFPQVMVRPRQRVVDQAVPTESVRSAVAWRRGASSLIWKEFRQAFPFCLALLVFGLIALGLVSLAKLAYWSEGSGLIPLMLITIAPLLPGVAAIRAERRNGAFRLLANRGVAPDGLVICKHLVWLSLSLSVFAILLIIDRSLLANLSGPSRTPSLWGSAAGAAESMSESAATGFAAPLAVAAFHVVLLYALGFLLGLLLPGPIVAFFGGAIVWLGLAFCWMVVVGLRIPFWWTVGLFPVIFLAAAWARTSDWLIEAQHAVGVGQSRGRLRRPVHRYFRGDNRLSRGRDSSGRHSADGARIRPRTRPRTRRRTGRQCEAVVVRRRPARAVRWAATEPDRGRSTDPVGRLATCDGGRESLGHTERTGTEAGAGSRPARARLLSVPSGDRVR